MIIESIIVFLILIGGITLYRTFALYEEKKEFNILNGTIPSFGVSNSDITLAFTIEGEKAKNTSFPTMDDGYIVSDVVCKDEVEAEWNSNLWGLVNINSNGNSKIECTVDFSYPALADYVSVGDYVSYTPSVSKYEIDVSLTGSNYQTINPSELNLWRVIRINDDKTIDVVSEYLSSTLVVFSGKIGYTKSVGTLNKIASQYESDTYTVSSRAMGYNISTVEECDEVNGSACPTDNGYFTDYNLVNSAVGTREAKIVGTSSAGNYWLASRYIKVANYYTVRLVNVSGSLSEQGLVSGSSEVSNGFYFRPIVTLKEKIRMIEGTMNSKKLWTLK